MIFLNIRHSSN